MTCKPVDLFPDIGTNRNDRGLLMKTRLVEGLPVETGELFGKSGTDHLGAARFVLPGRLDQGLDAFQTPGQMAFERATLAFARRNKTIESDGKGLAGSGYHSIGGPKAVVSVPKIEHAFQLKKPVGRRTLGAAFGNESVGDRKNPGQPIFVDDPFAGLPA